MVPWFAFILAVVAGVVLHVAASRAEAFLSKTERGEKHRSIGTLIQA